MNQELKKRLLTSLILLPIVIIIITKGGISLIIFLFFIYLLCLYEINLNSSNLRFKIVSSLFVFFSFSLFYFLRGKSIESLFFLFWGLFSTFLSDIGGYIFGRIFKGKKLTKISPNKTYSGSLGSFFLSLLSIPLMMLLQKEIIDNLIINFFQVKFFIFTLIISLIAQIGDIYISYWKRKLKIKDTSDLLPGHGGVLDRIDGLIFVIIFLSILNLFKII